ncbi:MAG TPA: polysaccharide deacetylase family protein [Solirubrobacteraceae bacterium]|nr:polysaccharide deacetylase family protein [Solirubrobacteraceae bacterium]
MNDPHPGPARDFVGYGRQTPAIEWPDGARVAVSLVINYEEGSEKSWLEGDAANEGLGELTHRTLDPGYRDLCTETVYEYGSRAGVFRLFRLLDEYRVPCTMYAAALALERNPDAAAWIRESGFETASHGWRWADDWTRSRDEQRALIDRAVASIETTTGTRPVGWYSRYMPSVHTRELLVEEGGFIYDSESSNDDLPYYVQVGGREHLIVPYSITYNDVHYFNGSYASPSDFVDYTTRALDYLAWEGETHPKMMSIGLHCRWTGQAGRASALREFIEHAQARGDVWFARRRDIAEWWLERYPPGALQPSARHEPMTASVAGE